MAIDIFNYDGTLFTTVLDGTIDGSSASINFFGRGYKGWGGPMQQDLLWMLQNFARSSAPSNPVPGQLWYDLGADNNTKIIKVWSGDSWDIVGPLGAKDNNNDSTNLINPTNNAIESLQIVDTDLISRFVWRVVAGGVTIAILSKDAAFTPDNSTLIANGFPKIYPGITFNNLIVGAGVSGDTTIFKTTQTNLPNFDNTWNLGSPSYKFANVYSTNGNFSKVVVGSGSTITAPSDGNVTLMNNASTSFFSLQLGGTSASYPAIKRNGAAIDFRLANDSGYANITANTVYATDFSATGTITSNSLSITNVDTTKVVLGNGAGSTITQPSGVTGNGNITLTNNAGTSFFSLQFGGSTAAFPAIKKNGTALMFRLADDTADADISSFQVLANNSDSAAAPGFAWHTNGVATTSGMFSVGTTSAIGFAVAGAEKLRIDVNGSLSTTGVNATAGYNLDLASGIRVASGCVAVITGTVTAGGAIASTQNDTTLATTAWVRNYGGFQGLTVITAAGSSSGTIPVGINKVKVTIVGGGGAGGGAAAIAGAAGSGGANGSTITRYYTGSLGGLTYTYTVGAGGTGNSGGAGNGGSATTFTLNGITITANGGSGGALGAAASTPYAGGAGGTIGVAGDINLIGSAGHTSIGSGAQATAIGGNGAAGFEGMGAGRGAVGTTAATAGAANTGAGGGGSNSAGTATAGAAGGSGIIIIEY